MDISPLSWYTNLSVVSYEVDDFIMRKSMKNRVKIKGALKSHLQTSLYFGIAMILVNILIALINVESALIMGCFTVVYCVITGIMFFRNKPIIMNELISFATEYGQIQRKLLKELELPYVLLDDTGKVMWTNKAFDLLTHKAKGFNRSISSLFPELTRENLPGEEEETEVKFSFESRDFNAICRKVSLKDMTDI